MTTRVITFKQPHASLIAGGLSQYLYRPSKPAKVTWDTRVGVHAASAPTPIGELKEFLDAMDRYGPHICGIRERRAKSAIKMIEGYMSDRTSLPTAQIIGTVKIRMPIRAKEIAEGNPGLIDPKLWAWPLSAAKTLKHPVSIAGDCGAWEYEGKLA